MTQLKRQLDETARSYNSAQDFDHNLIHYGFEQTRNYLIGECVLEMGCASGVMTRELVKLADLLHVVDGAKYYLEHLMQQPEFAEVTFYHALFEGFEPEIRYSDVIMARVLEHLADPVAVLRRVRLWLNQEGRLHIIVPNADSLHRRVGVALGMLETTTDLSERDHKYGHQRVYTKSLLEEHLQVAGYTVQHDEGVFLKPLSNAQMEDWDQVLLDAFRTVGEQLPGWCAEIYIVAGPT